MGALIAVLLTVALATTGCATGNTNDVTNITRMDAKTQDAQDFIDFYMPEYEISSEVSKVETGTTPTLVFDAKNGDNEFRVMVTMQYERTANEGEGINNKFAYAVIGADKTSFYSDMKKKALKTEDNWSTSIEEAEKYNRDLVYRSLVATGDEEAMTYHDKEFTDFYCNSNGFEATFEKDGKPILFKVAYTESTDTLTVNLDGRELAHE